MYNFRKRIKILPGLTMNLNKSGISWTVGGRGAHITYGRNRKTMSVGLPGTGIYARKTISTKSKSSRTSKAQIGHSPNYTSNGYNNDAYNINIPKRTKAANLSLCLTFLTIGIIAFIIGFLSPLTILTFMMCIIGALCVSASIMFFAEPSTDEYNNEEQQTITAQNAEAPIVKERNPLYTIPPITDEESAINAYYLCIKNLQRCISLEEILAQSTLSTQALRYSIGSSNSEWGGTYSELTKKFDNERDNAIIQLATKLYNEGDVASKNYEVFLYTDKAKEIWQQLFK